MFWLLSGRLARGAPVAVEFLPGLVQFANVDQAIREQRSVGANDVEADPEVHAVGLHLDVVLLAQVPSPE